METRLSTDSPLLVPTLSPLPTSPWLNRLQSIARLGKKRPGADRLRHIYHRILAVASPTEQMLFQPHPPRSAPPSSAALTVMTANLWHDWPRQRQLRSRLEAFAALVEREQVDVLLLQEVSRTPKLRVDEWLAQRLGMAYAYARANGHEPTLGFEEGLAVLSRYPLTAPRLRQLQPEPLPFVRRLALGATVRTHWGEMPVFSTHLALGRRQNSAQLDDLRGWIGDDPALVGGDFNAHETARQIKRASSQWLDLFRCVHPHADATTHDGLWGRRRRRLDYLFWQPGCAAWQILEARHLHPPDAPHSDHHAVLARLRCGA